MSEVTILKMGPNLVVPVQVELHDRAAIKLQDDILKRIEAVSASGLIIDISAVGIVDSFLGRLLGETASMARLLGTQTVLVGMKKEVVLTLIQLGMELTGLHTAINLEEGLARLDSLRSGANGSAEGAA